MTRINVAIMKKTVATRVVVALVIFGIPFLAFALLVLHPPNVTLLQPDSDSYLQFNAMRTGGYQMFLRIVTSITGNLSTIAIVQLAIFCVSVTLIAWQLFKLTGSATLTLILQFSLFFNPWVNKYHFMILSESVFLSASAIMCAFTIAFQRDKRSYDLILVGLSAGYATTVRPAGAPLILIALLLPVFFARFSVRAIINSLIVFVFAALPIFLEGYFYSKFHDGERKSLLPIIVFAKGGLTDVREGTKIVDSASPEDRVIFALIESKLESVRNLIESAPSLSARCDLLANYETFTQWSFRDYVGSDKLQDDGTLMRAGKARLIASPVSYVYMSVLNYYCLWNLSLQTRKEKDDLKKYLDDHYPLPFDNAIISSLFMSPEHDGIFLIRSLWLLFGLLLLFVGVLTTVRVVKKKGMPAWLLISGVCGISIHASAVFTAFFGVAIPRYMFGLWVFFALGAVCLIVPITAFVQIMRRPSRKSL